ncbi:MAG TPA: MFS transporter, partial [Ramlibacter sp.]|nr:MFS transporter [Ramlibacter sp.]
MNGGWKPLAITLAIQALATMAVMTIPSMAPRVAAALNVSTTYLGLYIALAYASAIGASLGAGAAVARYGAIRVSQACLLVCGTGLALSALPTVWATAAGAILIGLGYGPVTPASSHLLARTTPPHRMVMVFSIKQTGVP